MKNHLRVLRAALVASILGAMLLIGTGSAHAQTLEECYPLSAAECVEVQGNKFDRDPAPAAPAGDPAVAPIDFERTHPVTGFGLDAALMVALAAALAAAGLFVASRRVEARATAKA